MVLRELVNMIGFEVDITQMKAAEKSFVDMSVRLRDIGTKMSMLFTVPLTAMATAAVMAAAKVEGITTQFQVLTGSAEATDKLMKELFTFEAKTPFNLEEVLGYANSLIMMKVPLGEITSTMNMLGEASAGNAATMGSVMTQLFQIKMFGRAQTQDLKIMAQAGVPLFEKLQEITGKTGVEFRKLMEGGGISYDMTMEAMKRIAGDRIGLMEKQSKTLGGLWSSLQSAMFRFNAGIGKVIVESLRLKEVVQRLIGGLDSLAAWFTALPKPISTFIVMLAGALAAAGPLLLVAAGITKVLAVIAGAGGLGAVMAAALPVITILLQVVAVLGLLALAIDDVTVWMRGGDSVVGKMLGEWKYFGPRLLAYIEPIVDTFKALWQSVAQVTGGFFQWMIGIFTGDTGKAVKGLEKMIYGIPKILWNLALVLTEVIIALIPVLWTALKTLLSSLGTSIWTMIKSGLISFVDMLVTEASKALKHVADNTLIGKLFSVLVAPGLQSLGSALSQPAPSPSFGAVPGGFGMFAPSPLAMAGAGGSKNINVSSTVEMKVPEGTKEEQVTHVRNAAELAVQEAWNRQLRNVILNSPEVP